MARKSLFAQPMTAKERAMRSAANLKKKGGETIGLRLEPRELAAIERLLRFGHGKNKSEAIRNAICYADHYLNQNQPVESKYEEA